MVALILAANAAGYTFLGSQALSLGVATAIGTYFDNRFLFPPPDQVGPRLDKMNLGSASEGVPRYFCVGQENRVPGRIIWAGAPVEHEHRQGKGGPSVTNYTYTRDVAIGFGEGPCDGIDKIWLGGQLFYDDSPTIQITSNVLTVTAVVIVTNPGNDGDPTPITVVKEKIVSPAGGPDLSIFRSGVDVTISGWSNPANNGTFRVQQATLDPATGISELWVHNQNAVTQGAGSTVTLTQVPDKFHPGSATSVTVYKGTATQTVDPTIEAVEGTGMVPAYRGEIYVVIKDMDVTSLSLINPEAMVRMTASPESVGGAISKILLRAGRNASEFDVTALTGITLRGYAIRGPMPVIQQLGPILVGYDLLTQQDGGVLRFFQRSQAARVSITDNEFTLPENGDRRKIKFKDKFSGKVPNEVNVSYVDPASNYQQGSQRERTPEVSPLTDSTFEVDSLLVLSATEASALAKRILYSTRAARWNVDFARPPKDLAIAENDIVTVTHKGIDFAFLASQVTVGANGMLQVEARTEETQTLTQTGVAEAGGADDSSTAEIFLPADTILAPVICGPLQSADVDTPGFYWGGCYSDPFEPFLAGRMWESTNGTSYLDVDNFGTEAAIGITTTVLATKATTWSTWDEKSSVTVVLNHGELSSAADIDVLNGANHAMVGGEVIGFRTATMIGTRTYTLSGLLRGRFNTEYYTLNLSPARHATGERFVLLDLGTINVRQLDLGALGSTFKYKLVPPGGVVSGYPSLDLKVAHTLLRHYPPCDLTGERNGSNTDILVKWKRVSRYPTKVTSTTTPPLGDEIEQYLLEILGGTPPGSVGAVFGSYTVTGATQRNYSTAEQSADGFGTPGNARYARIRQVSSRVGNGLASQVYVI